MVGTFRSYGIGVHIVWALAIGMLMGALPTAHAQTEVDTFALTIRGDTAHFWAQLPAEYTPASPPAILIWWHQLGGSELEMRDHTQFETAANARGWIAASHRGPNDRHWNARIAQEHCRAVLDWIAERYPFARDSIYMIGGSMGGAAGQVWHNNNCGSDDYLIAATAGASQILDCQLRQEQYLADGQINQSMRAAFGGLPDEGDSVLFEYHRASAIYLADTTQSMHFNSLHLPVWNTWGNSDLEWLAYGHPAETWDSLRRDDNADTTLTFPTDQNGHGLGLMPVDAVCDWLSGFSANRYPDEISINADASGDYYWTHVELADTNWTFGRYAAVKDSSSRRLDISMMSNVASLEVHFDFSWCEFDSLLCRWRQSDPGIAGITAALNSVPEPHEIVVHNGLLESSAYNNGRLSLAFRSSDAEFTVHFQSDGIGGRQQLLPRDARLVSAYPNPFNTSTRLLIESSLPVQADLLVHDVLGRLVIMKAIHLDAGVQQVPLAAAGLASGQYFVTLAWSKHPPLRITLIR